MPVVDFDGAESERRSLLAYAGLILIVVGVVLFATLLIRDSVPPPAAAPTSQSMSVDESVPDEVAHAVRTSDAP